MKPILFSTTMVQAILDGHKTQTRRVIKPQPWLEEDGEIFPRGDGTFEGGTWTEMVFPHAPIKTGTILWVRETWTTITKGIGFNTYDEYVYKASASHNPEVMRWRPSIHMPKDAARLFLRVTRVRAEQLHDGFTVPVSPIFAVQAEGIDIGDDCRHCIDSYGEPCCVDTVDEDGSDLYGGECGLLDGNRVKFADLWDGLNKKRGHGWATNPWVWVIEFERCERPKDYGGVAG